MKITRTRMGLSILTGALSFVGSAHAIDLIVNGSFETGTNGWKYFNTYNYSQAYFTGPAVPASENPGNTWAWQHGSAFSDWDKFVTPTNEVDHLQYNLQWANSQTVNLTNGVTVAAIDGGLGRYSFSCWLASYGQPSQNPDQPYVVLRFFDDAGTTQIGGNIIFDRTVNTHAVSYANGFPNNPPPADLSADHDWVKYLDASTIPVGARKATVYLTRSPNAAKSNSPDTYTDLVKLDVFNVNETTSFDSSSPVNGQTGVSPAAAVTVVLKDVATQVNTGSIQYSFDGVLVTPTIQKSGDLTTIQYDPPGLMASLSTHTNRVVWSDNGGTVTTKTNEFVFTVAPYANITLGAPLHLETFDGVAEGALPSGWSVQNFTDFDSVPGNDLNNFHSDTFVDWTVISRSTLSNWFTVTPGGTDFLNVFNVAPNQVINSAVVTNLISTNFIIAVSDRSEGQKQIQYLFTGDYNLSGQNNVYLAFDSIWVQNQDSMAAVEYSINGGTTWLPAQYMLHGPDILPNASNTFATVYGDVPTTSAPSGGNYGQFIGVAESEWAGLSPYLSARTDDNQTTSKKVEIIRLAQADNQPAVRFRFANIGTYSWYWGLDNFGLYSVPTVPAPVLAATPTPAAQTVAAGNAVSLTIGEAVGAGPMTYQWRHYGTNLPGKIGQTLVLTAAQPSDAGPYDVVVTNPGGSVTSPPPAAVLTVNNPSVLVSGQWNFDTGLTAFVGRDLEYNDVTVEADTTFGTTTSFGIPDINGQPAMVMHFNPSAVGSSWGGYKMYHQAPPNGGGAYVNQYTLIFDLYLPFAAWRSLLQTGTGNTSDGDLFINPTGNGVGISSVYNGNITPGEWHRLAVAIDLTGPGSPVLTKFVDGVKVGNQTTGLSGVDGRFSLDTFALLFADQDGDFAETFVSSIQFSNGRRPDAFISALGGPSAAKIPGAIKASVEGGNTVIRWTGGVPLQSASSLAGPWTTLAVTSPYTPPPAGTAQFYRPKIP
ncbi:MAG TPA: hypothetical protein VFZ59_26410 [Verrucomicrobiae bacterium]|nr:hypothetical protein [Verrucomicrobiae bacterium]